jgi:hypothetical protein
MGLPLTASAQADLLPLAALDAGWNQVDPGGETTCAAGTPYAFFVRPVEDSSRLLIYFQGGGACWNAFSCNPDNTSVYDPAVSGDDLYATGIFDLENPLNPVADFNMVFIPYCTADVFTGSRTVDYSDTLTIAHQGYTNARAVLDWVYANFTQPSQVFITGSSAGSLGSIYHTADIMAQYAGVPVVQLGDGYVGLIPENAAIQDAWMIEANLSDVVRADVAGTGADFTQALYQATAQAFPQNTLAQFTTVADDVQVLFYGFMGGRRADVLAGIPATIEDLQADLPNFRGFVAEGSLHTILARPEFYTLEADGVTIRDWVAQLLTAEDVREVANVNCCAGD